VDGTRCRTQHGPCDRERKQRAPFKRAPGVDGGLGQDEDVPHGTCSFLTSCPSLSFLVSKSYRPSLAPTDVEQPGDLRAAFPGCFLVPSKSFSSTRSPRAHRTTAYFYADDTHLTDPKEVRDLLYKMQRPGIAPNVRSSCFYIFLFLVPSCL
jgi:hypothetical protein